ncbi:MAG TPA: PIN domain-containing protein [Rubrobacter sp.]|nr:PIN domain-containing protein [Rubrobacter sp.]
MVIVLDTSGLLAAIDSSQRFHDAAKEVLGGAVDPLILSPFVLAELDYLLATRVGREAELALLEEVARETYRLAWFSIGDVAEARRIIVQYADLRIDLADASNVVLANRHDTLDMLTLDERHFRTLSGPGGRPFRVLPADAG